MINTIDSYILSNSQAISNDYEELTMLELLGKIGDKVNEIVNTTNDEPANRAAAIAALIADITTNRKLSASGNFTGTLNGLQIVQADAGLASYVADHTAKLAGMATYNAADYPSLREMFAAINTGGTVKIPAGTYNETYVLLSGLSDLVIEGNGPTSKVKFSDMLSSLDGAAYYNTGEGVHFVVHNCTNIRFKNLAIEGVYDDTTPSGYSHGVVVSGTSDEIYFDNVKVSKFDGEGMLHNASGKVYINNCNISHVRNSGIGIANASGKLVARGNKITSVCYQTGVSAVSLNAEVDFQDNFIEAINNGCKLGHTGKSASGIIANNKFYFVGTPGTLTCFVIEVCDGMTIKDNYVQAFYYGINASAWASGNGNDLAIRGNKFKTIGNIAISSFLAKTGLSIEGNVIDGAVDGINLANSVLGSVIRNNLIKNITGKGIYLAATSTGYEHVNNLIDNNVVIGGAYGIYIGGRNSGNRVTASNVLTGQSTMDVYVELSNTYSTAAGNPVDYAFAVTPTLDGTPDNSNQTPSLNKGNLYVLPAGGAGTLYNVVRFDNAIPGQTVSFLAVDAYTVFKNGNNIALASDVTTAAGKVYTFKSVYTGGALKYYLTAVN